MPAAMEGTRGGRAGGCGRQLTSVVDWCGGGTTVARKRISHEFATPMCEEDDPVWPELGKKDLLWAPRELAQIITSLRG